MAGLGCLRQNQRPTSRIDFCKVGFRREIDSRSWRSSESVKGRNANRRGRAAAYRLRADLERWQSTKGKVHSVIALAPLILISASLVDLLLTVALVLVLAPNFRGGGLMIWLTAINPLSSPELFLKG